MARKPTPAPANKEVPVNEAVIQQDMDAANKLALATIERNDRVAKLAAQLNYSGSTEPAVLENSAQDAIKRIGMGIFELGAYLLLLRESSAPGEFLPALERLGLEARVAQQYMQVTRRFSHANSNSRLADLGKTKLLEMLVLDDEQLFELTELGQTGELALDDVATMSVKQLRQVVRTLRKESEATETVLRKKDERINRLLRDRQHFESAPASEQLAELQRAAIKVANEASGTVNGALRKAVIALQNMGEERDGQTPFIAGLVAQVQAALSNLRAEFDLPDTSTAQSALQAEGQRVLREGLAAARAQRARAEANDQAADPTSR